MTSSRSTRSWIQVGLMTAVIALAGAPSAQAGSIFDEIIKRLEAKAERAEATLVLTGDPPEGAGGGDPAPVPEPGTGLMLALGLAGLAIQGRRRAGPRAQ